MIERVLFIDPGERVGWAKGTIRDAGTGRGLVAEGTEYGMGPHRLRIQERGVHDYRTFLEKLHKVQVEGPGLYHVLGYETWRLRAAKSKALIGSEFLSSQTIGAYRLIGWLSGARLERQDPSEKHVAIASMPSELRATLDLSTEQHDQDAVMHLWLYYMKRYFDPTTEPC